VNVYVDKDGVYSIDKKWSKLKIKEKELLTNKDRELTALSNATSYLSEQLKEKGENIQPKVRKYTNIYAKKQRWE
jgi:hypothetical protein